MKYLNSSDYVRFRPWDRGQIGIKERMLYTKS